MTSLPCSEPTLLSLPSNETRHWSYYVANAVKHIDDLARYLQLPAAALMKGEQAHEDFQLMVPIPYLDRIEKGNLQDPLLLQILPDAQEVEEISGYVHDPLAESDFTPQKALVHKYKSRLLVIASGSCAVNCRYCFRRHFPYAKNQLTPKEWQNLLIYLKQHPEVNEVIFSGGDPLMMKDEKLAERVRSLSKLPQLKRVRIHTRLPVVIPQRINDELVSWVKESPLSVIFVFHINHANELDNEVSMAARKLIKAGARLLNQGVLLKGVNATVADQVALSEQLFDAGIMPYYMFTLDPVKGAAHFDVSVVEAQELMGKVAAELPGYLVPKLAKEVPGRSAKTVFAPILSPSSI